MELKKEFVKLPKDMVYDMYISLVYEFKDYDDISRSKMLDSIIKEYNQENYLYHICTTKELDFLKKFYNKKLSINDIQKYKWEIETLNEKCIFSRVTYEVFDEQKENVNNALKYYENRKEKREDDIVIFMISTIKTNAMMLTKVLIGMTTSLFNIKESDVEHLLGHPLFHFYCSFHKEWFEFLKNDEEIISYRKYYDMLDDISYMRKEYGIAGSIEFDIRDNYDIFYYGFPIRKETVKKMYDEVNKMFESEYMFRLIDEARVLNNRYILGLLVRDDKLLKIVNEALDDMPCAVMNGFTPNQYKKEKELQKEIDIKFSAIPQNNAHLCKNATNEFYKLYFALLEYTNDKFKISEEIKKIYQQKNLNAEKLLPIDKYLWENKNIIDDFIQENKYNFNKEELDIIEKFKNAVTSDKFVVIGFEREYTKILSEDGKIYMVKGLRCDLDKIIDPKALPKIIGTTLLTFKNNIVFNGFFTSTEIVFGNDIKQSILKGASSAIAHYHL